MKKFVLQLEKLSCKLVGLMATFILAAFTYWAGMYTYMTYVNLENLKVRLYEDSFGKNIGCLSVVLLVLFLFSKIIFVCDENINRKRVRWIAIIVAICAGIGSGIWVIIHNYEPVHDQLQIVADALDFLQGDYSDLKVYLEIYPHQIGLVFLYKLLFSVWPNYEIIFYVHIIWIIAIIYFTYEIAEELFGNSKISLYSIVGAALFVPMYFYVNYAYGDLSMAACGVLGIWSLMKLCKTGQVRYSIYLLGIMTISYLARTNAMIVILALAIILLVFGCSKGNWHMLLTAMLIIVLPLLIHQGIVSYYEEQAGVVMVKGEPAVLHIAMGMQDTYEGPGYYNAYNLTTYVNSGKDADKSASIARAYIAERMKDMKKDPVYTRDFYLLKIQQQWNEPSFSGELSTNTFSEGPGEFIESVYYGTIQASLRIFRNYYLFILYVGAFAGAFYNTFIRKEDHIWKSTIWVVLIGGFLFSILWENKSRYVMPYVVMLVPYSGYGLFELQRFGGKIMLYFSFEK